MSSGNHGGGGDRLGVILSFFLCRTGFRVEFFFRPRGGEGVGYVCVYVCVILYILHSQCRSVFF